MNHFSHAILGLVILLLSGEIVSAADKVFVAVGYGGRRLVSTDGQKWEITAQWQENGGDDSNNLMGLVFAQGKFVAVGGGGGGPTAGGHVLVSTDGRNWKETWAPKSRINPIAFGSERFVVGGGDRTLYWSKDAETWNKGAKLESDVATHFRHGAFGNERFVITGNHGGNGPPFWCAVTKDGESVSHLDIEMPNIAALAFGGERFVLVGEGGVLRSSVDGVTWDKHDINEKENLHWVIHTGQQFLAGGGREVYESPDGTSWQVSKIKVQGHPLWSDGTRIISTSWPGQMLYSPDGMKWEKHPKLTPNGINKAVQGEVKSP